MIQAKSVVPLIQVFDMARSMTFYRDKLGFEVVDATPDWAMLRIGGAYIMLNTRYEKDERPAVPDPAAARIHDDTILFFHCPNLEETYQYMVSHGVDAQPPKVAWYGMKQVYLKDPDGFALCFQWEAEGEATSTA